MNTKQAIQTYLDYRETDCTHSTLQSYEYRLNKFDRWLDKDLNDLEKHDVHLFRSHLQEDLAKPTIKAHLDTLRGFLDYMERLDIIDEGIVDMADSPTLEGKENVREDTVTPDVARAILDKLDRYEYASMQHALILLLWRTGMRTGGVRALDIDDYHPVEQYLDIEHRPESDTPLKNKDSGERKIAISDETRRILDDYVVEKRHDVTDENGREPLLATKHSRIARNTVRGWCYRLTRPCWYSGECPHDRELEECRASVERNDNYAYECPSSMAAHAFRKGSITHFLRNDMPEVVVSDRANVSKQVLDQHYDKRTEQEKMEQRRDYLDNI